MSVNRSLGYVQNFADFPGSFSLGGPRQYLFFAGGQRRDANAVAGKLFNAVERIESHKMQSWLVAHRELRAVASHKDLADAPKGTRDRHHESVVNFEVTRALNNLACFRLALTV